MGILGNELSKRVERGGSDLRAVEAGWGTTIRLGLLKVINLGTMIVVYVVVHHILGVAP